MEEIFKPIPGWEELYMISNYGRVYSIQSNKFITGDINNAGYERVCLYNKNHIPNKQRFFKHRLVALLFVPNPNNLPEVNHKDANKNNNYYMNLEWVSRLDNERHSRIYGNKIFKPYIVIYNDMTFSIYGFSTELASIIGVTNSLVKLWLHQKSNTYLNYGIIGIRYLYTSINIKA